MLLRRMISHVKAQNWLAVFLDFFIVVVGVLIAFQITEWSEQREAAKRREAALVRLHDESELAVGYFREIVGMYDDRSVHRSEAIRRMIDNDWEGVDLDAMTTGITSVGILPSASPPRSVYDEVISTGQFSELGDPALRTSISDYYGRLSFLQGQILYTRSINAYFPDWQHPGIILTFEPGTARERDYEIDFDLVSNDPDFIEGMIAGNNSMRAVAGWWRAVLEGAEQMCKELARATGQPCEPVEESIG
ncbi:hypothetical protein FF098_009715 [Parvularcula flava]|uniref:Uncharacterized protein n=1 Tax=Aquisalinus luteolus TaxID=1566827 RepID=A0A8J3A8C9_9PROT|nr:hypothetical protein [Aquisalinus luteolus]NHK28179.1 hypothetical protein [Aquisalinus luteolus]GGH97702.1 hypothetical protein GCM10011355_19560 [Aquisalinus luteolus]